MPAIGTTTPDAAGTSPGEGLIDGDVAEGENEDTVSDSAASEENAAAQLH